MSIYVALLRGINVGGRNLLAMSDLRDLFATMGLADARSLLQSGNFVFRADGRRTPALERVLEVETKKRFNISVDYFVRTPSEWQSIVDRNPFADEAKQDPSHLVVVFLKKAPGKTEMKALQAAIKGPEIVRSDGTQLYIVYPAGIGRSKLTNVLIERILDTRGTGRNWNTVLKLDALSQTD